MLIEQLESYLNWSTLILVVDVILVAYVIYRVLLMVRGTRAQPMLIGFIIIGLVYYFSKLLGLVTLTLILGSFLGSAILVVVILFQDDIRRGLIKVGLGTAAGGSSSLKLEHTIKEISSTAGELAQKRIGALIVLSQEVGLEDYTEDAVSVDALVSQQLLLSIFNPTSPLHDGAVVIEEDRIVSAGTVLPLTFNQAKVATLGTRHRAAMGLSERADAIIVVVSEETGSITLVREGKLTKNLDERSLFNALHRLTIAGAGQKLESKA